MKPDNDDGCKFYNEGNLTVFETPSPYFNNMRCKRNVTCSDPSHSVHYEFEYFETESGYDELYVNTVMYEGWSVQTNEWIDSYSPKVDLYFESDGSVTERGFKMNLKCDLRSPEPTSDIPEVTTDVTAVVTAGSCYFQDFGDNAVFDTGEPYSNSMRKGLNILNQPKY